jgi:hypothetical protein
VFRCTFRTGRVVDSDRVVNFCCFLASNLIDKYGIFHVAENASIVNNGNILMNEPI